MSSKKSKAAKNMREAFRGDGLVSKLKKAFPRIWGDEDKEDANKIKPKSTKDYLTKSLKARRGL